MIPNPPLQAHFSLESSLSFRLTPRWTRLTLSLRADWDYRSGRWRHTVFGDAYRAEQDAQRSADRYAIGYKPHVHLRKQWYGFSLVRHDADRFSGTEAQTTVAMGLGRDFAPSPRASIEVEVGFGGRSSDYRPPSKRGDGGEEFIGFLGGSADVGLTETASLAQDLRVEGGQENVFVESITVISLSVTNKLKGRITYTVRHNTELTGVRGTNTDRIMGAGLLHSF